MVTILLGGIAILLMLVVVVGLHELGHFIAARSYGVRIKQFSIGFGPSLFSYHTQSQTTWHWRLWPLGGYVEMLNSRLESIPETNWHLCLDKKKVFSRIIIYLSGVTMNLLVAFLAISLMYGVGVKQQMPTIKSVTNNSIASRAGLQAHDKIIRVDGGRCYTWREFAMEVLKKGGTKQKSELTVKRDGALIPLNINLSKWHYSHKNKNFLDSIGIKPTALAHVPKITIRFGFIESLTLAWSTMVHYIVFFCIIIKQLVAGNIPFMALLGPLGMLEATATIFSQGLSPYLNFLATFSIAVALVNLIPLPGLDGAQVVYCLIEKGRKKPMSVAFEALLQQLSTIVVMVLFVRLLMNDLNRFYSG